MSTLPQLSAEDIYLTDGGLETTLVFHDGIDLPDFAAFPLLDTEDGRAALDRYYAPYLDLGRAARRRLRARHAHVAGEPRLGRAPRVRRDRARRRQPARRRVRHAAGRRRDRPGADGRQRRDRPARRRLRGRRRRCRRREAAAYHGLQARAFAEAGAEMMTAVTMTYADEAIGVVRAAGSVGLPVVDLVHRRDRRPAAVGQDARRRDRRGRRRHRRRAGVLHGQLRPPHPLRRQPRAGGPWVERVKGIRANASTLSHAELDEADRARPRRRRRAGRHYAELRRILPDLRVVGGCCGTDAAHISAIAAELSE